MGLLTTVRCERCEYAASVPKGFGFSGIVYEPMVCADCLEVRAIPTGTEVPQALDEQVRGRCPECGGTKVTSLARQSARSVDGQCPKCGGTLVEEPAGKWD